MRAHALASIMSAKESPPDPDTSNHAAATRLAEKQRCSFSVSLALDCFEMSVLFLEGAVS